MSAIGLKEFTVFLGLSSVVGAAVSGTITALGTDELCDLSKLFAAKEQAAEVGSKHKTAYKVAKWATLGFAAVVGTFGAALTGALTAFSITAISFGKLTPVGIGVGVAVAVLLEIAVVKKITKQAKLFCQ